MAKYFSRISFYDYSTVCFYVWRAKHSTFTFKYYVRCSLFNILYQIRTFTSIPNFLRIFFSYHEGVLTLTETFSAFIKMFIYFFSSFIKVVNLIE